MKLRRWYIGQQGRQLGPYREAVLKILVENQKLHPHDLLWTDGMPDWMRADSIADLALFSEEVPPNTPVEPDSLESPAPAQTPTRAEKSALVETPTSAEAPTPAEPPE